MNPQRFPWHLLDRTTDANARALRDARRFLSRLGNAARLLERFAELSHAAVDVQLQDAAIGPPTPRAGSIAVAFTSDVARGAFAVVVESALAAAVVSRGIKRAAPRVVDPNRSAPLALAGAFAAIAVAASRALVGGPISVAWCGDAADLAPAALADSVLDVRVRVTLDEDAFEARLLLSEAVLTTSPSAVFSSADLIALGDTPLALSVVASASLATRAEVASLSVRDIWMPGAFLTRGSDGKFFGDVVLASPARESGVRARLGEDGALVLVDDAKEIFMTPQEGAVTETLADAPLVVRVEIGTVTLSAREWGVLAVGDVITANQKINAPVILRVGGVEVARGELVDVEGEVGVRILSRS